MTRRILPSPTLTLTFLAFFPALAKTQPTAYFEAHCYRCHDATEKKGGFDLTALKVEPGNPDNFARWLKVHDRIEAGEMPPRKLTRPPAAETAAALKGLRDMLVKAEREKQAADGRTRLRRLTRVEYENTVRDLLELPGVTLQGELPADGSAHGFDNNSDALDISHVNLAKYIEAADRRSTWPLPPGPSRRRW